MTTGSGVSGESGRAAADRWPRVEAVLDEALELEGAARAAFVARACGGDAALRAEVEQLLAACDAPHLVPDTAAAVFAAPLVAGIVAHDPAADLGTTGERRAPIPARIGPYRVLRRAGEGGMGTVYEAERDDGHFRMRVALKLLRRGLRHDDAFVRRFHEERRILARLEHASVARLLDGGVTDEGVPYYVMEYVDGEPIDRWCDARGLGCEARLALFARVCDAVAYAHARHVVHRDLKPSNIHVTADGTPKLLDFGIAKLLRDAAPARAGEEGATLTRTGQRLLTPEFASPEQIRGEPVTAASDVYALGVLLFELLTGRRPFTAEGRTPHQVERAILEEAPPRPSEAALGPPAPGLRRAGAPARLHRRLRGDLDAVVLAALRKEPERRYPSAAAFADDVRRHLDGQPVRARGDGPSYRLRKWMRRHRVSVAAAGAGMLAGVAAIVAIAPGRVAPPSSAAVPADGAAPAPVLAVGRIVDHSHPDVGGASASESLRDLLATNLARLDGVRVVSAARVLELLRTAPADSGGYLDAARRAGATHLLEGALYEERGRLRLDLQRSAVAGGAVLGTSTVHGPDLFALVDSGTARLAADLRAPTPVGSVAGVTTRSLVAYGLYAEGVRAFYQNDMRGAQRLFDAALREDSLFALAAFHGALAAPFRMEAMPRMARALRLSERATARERLLIRAGWADMASSPELLHVADTLTTRYPDETDGHLYTGIARRALGDFAGAIAPLRRVVAMDSLQLARGGVRCAACDAQAQIVHAYVAADSLPAAEREARRWAALQPQSGVPLRLLWDILVAQHRDADADSVERRLLAVDPTISAQVDRHAVLGILRGRFAATDAALRQQLQAADATTRRSAMWYSITSLRTQGRLVEAAALARRYRADVATSVAGSPPEPGAVHTGVVPQAQVLFEQGRHREAAALFDSASRWSYREEAPSSQARERVWNMTHASNALVAAGDTAALAARADRMAALGARTIFGRVRPLHHYVRGLLLEARGDLRGAESELRRAIWSPAHGYTRLNLVLARVLQRQGRPREAAAALETALRGKLDASGYYATHAELHAAAGDAWAAAGEPARAASHYRYTVNAWRQADPPFAARRRAMERWLALHAPR